MENNTRTLYGNTLQSAKLLGIPHVIQEFSTLNEKLGIQSGVLPASTETPDMQYYSIGNGGHGMSSSNGIPKPRFYTHKSTDSGMFSQLPFVLREQSNDLAPEQRVMYALRREETYNNQKYFAYYLKRLDFTGISVQTQMKTVVNGQVTTTAFVPNNSNLNPTPAELTEGGVNVLDGVFARASATIALPFSADDVTELLNVANIIYNGDTDLAIISEVGFCSGVDKVIQTTGAAGAPINFNEAIGVQICSFMKAFYPVSFMSQGFTMTLDAGATEPLFNIKQATV